MWIRKAQIIIGILTDQYYKASALLVYIEKGNITCNYLFTPIT